MRENDRKLLSQLFEAAVAAAQPELTIKNHLPEPPRGKTLIIGAGKASAQMGRAFRRAYGHVSEGLIVTRTGFGCPVAGVEVVEGAHPVPDGAGADAARRIAALVAGLGADDLLVALISGGGSALLPSPMPGLTLGDEIALNQSLLSCGAPISAMNAIRKQFSCIKGGRLAALAHPARVHTLIISDVPGDDPAMVASGPTVPDETTPDEARALVSKWCVELPRAMQKMLDEERVPAPLPNDPRFADNEVHVIASAALSLAAAAKSAISMGLKAVPGSDAIEGEAKRVGHADGLALKATVAEKGRRVFLSGGETSVTVGGGSAGRGGRNCEYLLALALVIEGVDGVAALAADTDGIDGNQDNAGAFADGTSVARMRAAGVDPEMALAGHDSYTAFEAVGDLFMTGPTGTNVNDFRALLVR
ncbi:MAG: glycerate kinase [Alphaproteobacteria bacterium]|nr:glycerate kinase [Alphaproteobacteria bacterium]